MSDPFSGTIEQLPDGWSLMKTTEILRNSEGAIKIGPFGSQLRKEYFVQDGFKVYGQENIFEKNFSIGDRRITTQRFLTLSSCELRPRDVVITMMGTIGQCAVVPNDIEPGIMDSHLLRLKVSEDKLIPELLAQMIADGWFVKTQIRRLSVGGIMEGLSSKVIKRLQFPCPPIPIQHRILEIFSTVDDAIEQTESLIKKYKQIKVGLMHDLFTRGVTTDGRLRPTQAQAPHLYKNSLLGWIPKEWEAKQLGAILRQFGGYLQTGPFGSQLHAHEYLYEGVPVVMPQDINDGIVSNEQVARISQRKAEELSRHRMRVGDIVIARRGELSRAAAIHNSQEGWLCGTGCFLLRLGRSSLHSDFATYVYRHDLIQRQIAGLAVGTTMPSLNNTVMERLFFPFCDLKEQSRIIEHLNSIEQILWLTEYKVAKFYQQKQGLMHDLLSGRVKVNV